MNSDLTAHYQELVDIFSSYNEHGWESFKLEAKKEGRRLILSLTFIYDDHEEDSESLTSEVFDVIEAIQAATPPEHVWSEWVFQFQRDGRYNIEVKYPDDAGTDGNG